MSSRLAHRIEIREDLDALSMALIESMDTHYALSYMKAMLTDALVDMPENIRLLHMRAIRAAIRKEYEAIQATKEELANG
jgi:hypothetical protein